jgi:hypothetical protein
MQTMTTKTPSFVATLKMVERSIKQYKDYPTEGELWKSLPVKIPRRVLKHILKRLAFDRKIMYGKGRTIIWSEADALQRKILREEFTVLH